MFGADIDTGRAGLRRGAIASTHDAGERAAINARRPSRLGRLVLLIAAAATAASAVAGVAGSPVAHAARASSSFSPKIEATVGVQNGGHPGSYAWGVAAMPDGNTMLVGDIFNNRVLRYDLSGNPYPSGSSGIVFKTRGLGANAYGLAVDPNDWTIYVGSAQCCGVQVWTTTDPKHIFYTYKTTIDPTGGAHGTVSRYPARLAVANDGTVYVADMTLDTISAFTSQASGNNVLYRFGGYGTGPAQFKEPRGLALDGHSPQRLYAVDSANFRVQVFDTSQMSNPSTHGYLYSFGSLGPALSNFGGNLRGIAYDKVNEQAYIVDIGKNHVEEWQIDPNATSAAQDSWVRNVGKGNPNLATQSSCCAPPGYFSDGGREAGVDGSGNLWVGDMPNFRAQVFAGAASVTPAPGSFLFDAPSASSPLLPPTGQFSYPEGVGVEPDGTVWVSDSHNFRLQWLDTAANGYAFKAQEGSRGRFNDYALAYARNISVNSSNGDFALADTYNNSVHYYAENGTALWTFGGNGSGGPDSVALGAPKAKIKSPLLLPAGVGVDNSTGTNAGDVYIADSGDKQVVVVDSSGNQIGTIVNGSNNGLSINLADPRGLAVDPSNGDLYVADFPAKVIYHFTITGSWSAKTQVVTLQNIIPTGAGSAPFDVVVDPTNQYLYVSDTHANTIVVYSTVTQSLLTSFVVPGQPEGLALAPNGDVYTVSKSNDKLFDVCFNNCP